MLFTDNMFRSEGASNVYSTEVMTRMLIEEGGNLFDSRSAELGHTLQGGTPSPMDRVRAVRLSLKCMAFLERHHDKLSRQGHKKHAGPDSAAVITIQSSTVEMVPVVDMVRHADMVNRRPKQQWWENVKDLVEALSGRTAILSMHTFELERIISEHTK